MLCAWDVGVDKPAFTERNKRQDRKKSIFSPERAV